MPCRKEGWEEGMGNQTFHTAHTLDRKPDQDRVNLNGTFVTAVTDETAFLPTGAFNLRELQFIHHTVILLLRKIIAIFKDNCYHDTGNIAQRGIAPGAVSGKTGRLWRVGLSLLLRYSSSMESFFPWT